MTHVMPIEQINKAFDLMHEEIDSLRSDISMVTF